MIIIVTHFRITAPRTSVHLLLLSQNCTLSVVQTISRPLSTSSARVQSADKSHEICNRQSGIEVDFLQILIFPLPILIPPTAPYSVITLSPTLYILDTKSVVK
jgi:hypothetical protein